MHMHNKTSISLQRIGEGILYAMQEEIGKVSTLHMSMRMILMTSHEQHNA